jgi:EmrB/QacA subfamily drug resistance transporter
MDTDPPVSTPGLPLDEPDHRHDRMILVLACIAQFMVILDVSIVNVALPSIGRALHYSPTGLQWVVNAYVLTFAGFLLLGGRAADLYGRRRVYMFGLVLFAAASLVGGFAQTSAWLTTARAVQGIGGAFLSPATLTIIVTTFSGARLAKALGLWSAMGGAGAAAGVLLGGVLTSELSWRWVLFVNVPIAAVTLLGAVAYLTEIRRGQQKEQRLDVAGAVTVTLGLGILVYAIVNTDKYAWGSARTLVTLAIAVVLLGVFLVMQLRTSGTPLVPLRLFRSRWVTTANLIMLLVGAAFFSMWYFLSLYLQNVLDYSALRTGLAFAPMCVMIVIGAQGSSRLLAKLGARRLLTIGTLMAAIGFGWLTQIGSSHGYWTVVFGGANVVSLALGILFTPLAAAGTTGVLPREAGLASGVLNTSRQVGGSIGLAALATVATSHTNHLVHSGSTTQDALASGYGRAFAVACGLTAVGFLISLFVPTAARATTPAADSTPAAAAATAAAAAADPGGGAEPAGTLDPA